MFQPVESNVSFPALEAEIGRFWKEGKIYEKSLLQRAGRPRFVFYEGPPTANGMPHPGHCLTRAIKDLFPRYRTMRGFLCERKAGWDTHGLPVEVEVCKELGIHSKEEIEAYGVEPFIQKCQQSVWRYMKEWERLTERIGFWIRLDEAYVTYHQSYIESVWASLAELFNRGLLYQGHKIVWWWAQGGTALSAGEVGLGYREVADPSVYVLFPLLDDAGNKTDENLLVWTTTPWTLPGNQFAAVHPDVDYVEVLSTKPDDPTLKGTRSVSGSRTGAYSESASEREVVRFFVAKSLADEVASKVKRVFELVRTLKGHELVERRYEPPFSYYYARPRRVIHRIRGEQPVSDAWRVVAESFVTTAAGTGIVHIAPAFGEDDYVTLVRIEEQYELGRGPGLKCPVGPDGRFNSDTRVPETQETIDLCGRLVDEAYRDITRDLRHRGLLYHQEQYLHEYPFCWRADEDRLIQYPRESWFIRTTAFKDEMLKNNRQINWLPEHIRDGRFGNFLESNVDWTLSRERYWGTPLPLWKCNNTGKFEAISSYDELLQKPGIKGTDVWEAAKKANPELTDHLKVHKPYIDAVTYDSPFVAGARMERVPDVIDCWYDSGAMPFAQWGYPHQGKEKFREQFPADFISEALDQTRGWFYSQLAISTLLFRDPNSRSSDWPAKGLPLPFKNCIVLGLMLGEDGNKMSKSKRNYREPQEIFDRYGADALRWYFFANQPPWTSIRYSERAIKESIPEFLLKLWHVYSFFVIYATIDGFDPAASLAGDAGELEPMVRSHAKDYRPVGQRSELDRWVLSELHHTAAAVTERMDAYDNFAACGRITEFVDALSNWYVRRSRDRFWSEDKQSRDKRDAYWTLYECLITTAKLVAPFVPFLAEALWQNLAVAPFRARVTESVHLCDFPTGEAAAIDELLSARMSLVREIASQGRAARMGAKLKIRQPLAKVEVILADKTHQAWLAEHAALLREELNVKQVEFTEKADQYITYTVLPDLKRLGPRLGKRLPALKAALLVSSPDELLARLERDGQIELYLSDFLEEGPAVLFREDLQVRLQPKAGWAAAHGKAGVVVLSTELTDELISEGLARELVHAIQGRRRDDHLKFTDRIRLGIVTDSAQLRTAVNLFADYVRRETLALEIVFEPLPGVNAEPPKFGPEIILSEHCVQIYLQVAPSESE
jgi:isoleucyl-tRNA synthetase